MTAQHALARCRDELWTGWLASTQSTAVLYRLNFSFDIISSMCGMIGSCSHLSGISTSASDCTWLRPMPWAHGRAPWESLQRLSAPANAASFVLILPSLSLCFLCRPEQSLCLPCTDCNLVDSNRGQHWLTATLYRVQQRACAGSLQT